MVEKESPYKKYLREERLPHIFCPGCGNGTVMSTFFKGLEGTDIDFENVAMVSVSVALQESLVMQNVIHSTQLTEEL